VDQPVGPAAGHGTPVRHRSSAESSRFLQIIHEESMRLTRLLDSTLDLSLLERGHASGELLCIDPELALESAVRTCQGLAVNTTSSPTRSDTTAVRTRSCGSAAGQLLDLPAVAPLLFPTGASQTPVRRLPSNSAQPVFEVCAMDASPVSNDLAIEPAWLERRRATSLPPLILLSRLFADDNAAMLAHGLVVYDALYAWARDAGNESHNWPPAVPAGASL
jgi:hypothetical protein